MERGVSSAFASLFACLLAVRAERKLLEDGRNG